MKKNFRRICLLLVFSILFIQCSKNPVVPKVPVVYVVGNEFHDYFTDSVIVIAKIWVNGVPTDLNKKPSLAEGKSVFVSGKDVYVAGSFMPTVKHPTKAVLWKNNIPTYLPGDSAWAFNVSVSGNDVYVSGYAYVDGAQHGVIWKNGVISYLNNGWAYYGNIFTDKNDVYMPGYRTTNGTQEAAILKNGQPILKFGMSDYFTLSSLYVSGGDIYASGMSNSISGYGSFLWKNGVPYVLAGDNSTANSVFVNNSNVYVTGRISLYQAALWKNNVSVPLQSSYASEGFSVFEKKQDVYVAGIGEIKGRKPMGEPVLWKNGVKTVLPTNGECGFATSVFVD